MSFFFESRPIWEAWALNTYLLAQIGIVVALLIPLGFLIERMPKPWRRVVQYALVAIVVAGVLVGTATAADLTPCVVCTLDSILALVVCYMFWC